MREIKPPPFRNWGEKFGFVFLIVPLLGGCALFVLIAGIATSRFD